jgi:hypothetical protein
MAVIVGIALSVLLVSIWLGISLIVDAIIRIWRGK